MDILCTHTGQLAFSTYANLKWYYDENLIFPNAAILKHKQEACVR